MTRHMKSFQKNKKHTVVFAGLFAAAVLLLTGHMTGSAYADMTDTEVTLGVADDTEKTVSFSVPLYYTMAVVGSRAGKDAQVLLAPEEDYYICNNSTQTRVAVTGLQISSIAGADWTLVSSVDDASTTKKEMKLTIGGIELPSVVAGNEQKQEVSITTGSNTFYDGTKYLAIGWKDGVYQADHKTMVPVTAVISKAYLVPADKAAKAQFRICYTLSPVDASGNKLVPYVKYAN